MDENNFLDLVSSFSNRTLFSVKFGFSVQFDTKSTKILEAGSRLLASAESLACRERTRREAAAGSRARGAAPGAEISTDELVHNFSI